jgi:hypothetical protein
MLGMTIYCFAGCRDAVCRYNECSFGVCVVILSFTMLGVALIVLC